MKKNKILALAVTLVMTFSFVQFGMINVSAAGTISKFSIDGCSITPVSYNSPRMATDEVSWWWRQNTSSYYLFLPSTVDPNNLVVNFTADAVVTAAGKTLVSGQPTNAFVVPNGVGNVTVTCGTTNYTFRIKYASKIPAMFVSTVTNSLNSVHNNKEYKGETAKMTLVDEANRVWHNADVAYLKGRGNATWKGINGGQPWKNPYNIKLNTKTDLLGMGASKGWSLLANAYDPCMSNNKMVFDLGLEIGIEHQSKSRMVDLYINNEYRGIYQLTEKVDVEETHVNITNLEKATESANGVEDLSVYSQGGTNDFGKGNYKYYNIPKNPTDITGGYLLEWELWGRYQEKGGPSYNMQQSGFCTTRGQAVVIKEPEFASKEQVEYIRKYVQEMEDAIYSTTGKNSLGKHYTEYVDLDSWARMWALQEFSLNLDVAITSFYMFKDTNSKGDGKLHTAPAWDFDNALGQSGDRDGVRLSDPTVYWTSVGRIYDNAERTPHIFNKVYNNFPEFKQRVTRTFHKTLVPAVNKMAYSNNNNPTTYVKHIEEYRSEIIESSEMNRMKWAD